MTKPKASAELCAHNKTLDEACFEDGCCRVSESTIANVKALENERRSERDADAADTQAAINAVHYVADALSEKAVQTKDRSERLAYAEAAVLVRKLLSS